MFEIPIKKEKYWVGTTVCAYNVVVTLLEVGVYRLWCWI